MYILNKLLQDIKNHKDLIYHLTFYDLKSNTARTVLGFLWWLIDPILYMAIFYFLVHVILERGGPDYPVFLFVALIPLKWTISCLVDSTSAITSKGRIIQQIYVPKIVFILFRLMVNTAKFLIGSTMLIIFLWLYGVSFSVYMLFFPLIIIIHLILLLACASLLAHVGVYLRDVKLLMQYVARTLFYLSPVLYSLDRVPEHLVKWLYMNPLTTFIVSYRNILLYQAQPLWLNLIFILMISGILLYLGLKIVFKYEKEYAKVI